MNDAILQVENLVGGYGKMTILNGRRSSSPRGAITTIIGPNGAGKSTALKAVFGLVKLRAGRILFDGHDIAGQSQRQLIAAGLCYVPQGRNIFPSFRCATISSSAWSPRPSRCATAPSASKI